MLGHRGCRLVISFPEIAEMQARAIFEAAIEAAEKTGKPVIPEIMVPLVATKAELDRVAGARSRRPPTPSPPTRAQRPDYIIGTMIELPRAALQADKIAESAAFFSFGTNDLTQTTFGLSRDDAASFLGAYTASGILADRPLRHARYRWRRRTDRDRRRPRPRAAARHQARHLRRAWRRPGDRSRFCEEARPRLRLLLAVPGADRAARRRAGLAPHARWVSAATVDGAETRVPQSLPHRRGLSCNRAVRPPRLAGTH